MAIQSADIQLIKSATMADVPEGGGAPSGVPILDGVSNAIFPDISELDRAMGRVAFRKIFGQVASSDTDTYFGANVVVAEPPKDPRVSVTLFKGKAFDIRTEAKTRVESYLAAGPLAIGYLFENHIAGQRAIQIFQRPADPALPVGSVLVLRQNEGQPGQKEQFVRATAVKSQIRTFTDPESGKDYQAAVVTLDISDALRYDFTGSPPSKLFAAIPGATKLRETLVADAGNYAGVVPLAQAAAIGDFTIKAQSIFSQLVPSAQAEVPMAALLPYADLQTPVKAAASINYTAAQNWTTTQALALPSAAAPSSIAITVGGTTITDDGAGILRAGGAQFGTVDYVNGILTINTGSLNGSKAVTYRPAGFVLRAPRSAERLITIETRSLSYAGVITPLPSPSTLSVAYRAQGRWYVLKEAGGVIKGADPSYGAGTFNADTGSYIVTLGALPDVGSSIIFIWGAQADEFALPSAALKASQTLELDDVPRRSTVTLTWPHESGTGTRSATANAQGQISGDATGTVTGSTIDFRPNKLPLAVAALTVGYAFATAKEEEYPTASAEPGGKVAVVSTKPIEPGTLALRFGVRVKREQFLTAAEIALNDRIANWPDRFMVELSDDGLGNVLLPAHLAYSVFSLKFATQKVGTVDYGSGAILFAPELLEVAAKVNRIFEGGALAAISGAIHVATRYASVWMDFAVEFTDLAAGGAGSLRLRYESGATAPAVSKEFAFAPKLRLGDGFAAPIAAGSVVLTGGGYDSPLGDNGLGAMRTVESAGVVQRGTINYLTREIELSSWTTGADNQFQRVGTVLTGGAGFVTNGVFRTAAAPLRPGSLSIQFAGESGTQTVTADLNGVISGPLVSGLVDYEVGIVRLAFGAKVTAAGHEAEPWYDAAAVDAQGKIWQPTWVALDSLRYSCVAYSYLPLDADILGLDPVRLPSDGRVPIFRAGGVAVVGHTGRLSATVANGQSVDCGRVRLSRVRVLGADGLLIHAGWSANLEAGTVSFSDVAGYSQPVTIEHRIEDMAVVRDVQIDGSLSFTRALTHAYPLPAGGDASTGSYVASALVQGDVFARTSLTFDQQSWTGAWSDSLIGNDATATFNAALYPIAVSNAGALTERWAVRFTSNLGFEVIGEHVGIVATGNTSANCAPINPATGAPYFSIPALGWGSGWVPGNVLRFNTEGAQLPVWVVRTVQQGPESVANDDFTLLVRGDVDTP